LIVYNETCDDQNTNQLDGCDSNCRIEAGYVCDQIPSNCTCDFNYELIDHICVNTECKKRIGNMCYS